MQNSWIRPTEGAAKFNVDGAFSCNGNKSAAAAICRDAGGNYLGSSATVFDGLTGPGIVESLACREALGLDVDLQLTALHIASGCKEVVEDVKNGTLGRYGTIVREIVGRAAHFEKCTFSHERRNSNYEAHMPAKFASSLRVGRHVWLGTPHDISNAPLNIIDE